MDSRSNAEDSLAPWLGGRPFALWKRAFDDRGYVVFENVLSATQLGAIRAALSPWLEGGKLGRNDFEGFSTNRVYALLAKGAVFADLAIHPLALAFAEADLGPSLLLSSCLAINLHPGETVQAWHFDDSPIRIPRPRPPCGVSTFWAIDATTETNGATEVIPGSHLWGEASVNGDRADAVALCMPAGSVAIAKGALWHRGGANRSDAPRLIITPQYCAGWARPLETMLLAVPPHIAAGLPERARELIGYSIHPPFIGYVDGLHPKRRLEAH